MEPEKLIYQLRDVLVAHPRLLSMERDKPKFVAELIKVQRDAREFSEQHVDPVALDLDKRVEEDSSYFPWDIVGAALPYRFLSYTIPKAFGGVGFSTVHVAVLMEELCAHCPGIANIFGAHALGVSAVVLSLDMKHFTSCLQDVATAEARGIPKIFALAITEPGAGSDYEDKDVMDAARFGTFAKKVKGGYLLNGRKVFISNGSIARYISVGAALDRENLSGSMVWFVVPNDAPGFSVGTIEKKLGQRACPAAELVFEDVFVPERDRIGDEGEGEPIVSTVLGVSRAPVAAIATGIARGAFERLLRYLNENKENGRYLFERQWVQLMLVDLMTKLQMARALYMDAAMCCDAIGIPSLMDTVSMKTMEHVPSFMINSIGFKRLIGNDYFRKFANNLASKRIRTIDFDLIATLSSQAKFAASDLAMEITSKAMDLIGPDGPVREYGLEKAYRDAKLTQIYEGTNQINRLMAFKKALG
jgi:butyryl-CoA dehydrogenase